jgi:hypothetical protein
VLKSGAEKAGRETGRGKGREERSSESESESALGRRDEVSRSAKRVDMSVGGGVVTIRFGGWENQTWGAVRWDGAGITHDFWAAKFDNESLI